MYYVKKKMEIAGCHRLTLPYESNELLPFNPTAENIAHWICGQVPHCYKVEVEESSNNSTIYVKDEDGSDCGFSQKG